MKRADPQSILADYLAGKPVKAIAKEQGVSRQRIEQIAADLALPPRWAF